MTSAKKCKELANDILNTVKVAVSSRSRVDVQTALSAVDTFILETKGPSNSHFYATRKKLIPLRNTLNGLLDSESHRALSSGVVKYNDNIRTYLRDFVETCQVGLKSKSLSAKVKEAKSDTEKDLSQALRDQLIKENDLDTLIKHQVAVSKLPKRIDDGFLIAKSSVIPTFNKEIKDRNKHFDKVGISYDKIDFYFLLNSQTLLAFNSSVKDKLGFVNEALDVINESGNEQFVLVSDAIIRHPNPDYNVSFAWIMNKTKFQKLTNLSGSFSVRFWSFPLSKKK